MKKANKADDPTQGVVSIAFDHKKTIHREIKNLVKVI